MRHGPKIGKTRQTFNEICSSLPLFVASRGNFSKGNRDEFPQNQTFPQKNHKIVIYTHTYTFISLILWNTVKLLKFNDYTF